MPAIKDNMKQIVLGLLSKSKRSEVNWSVASDFGEQSTYEKDFIVTTKNITINLFQPGENHIRLNILNSNADLVDYTEQTFTESDYRLLEELLDLAGNKSRKYDETMTTLLEELNKDGEFGANAESDTSDEIPF